MPAGYEFLNSDRRRLLGFDRTLLVYAREPAAARRALAAVGDAIHAEVRLGRYQRDDVDPTTGSPIRGPERSSLRLLYTGMSELLRAVVPRGLGFWIVLALLLAGNLLAARRNRVRAAALASAVLLCGAALAAGLAVFLDGQLELQRHLAGARFCFDLVLMISAAIAIQVLIDLAGRAPPRLSATSRGAGW